MLVVSEFEGIDAFILMIIYHLIFMLNMLVRKR